LKEEALDRTMWRNHFGRGFGPVDRQYWMNQSCFCNDMDVPAACERQWRTEVMTSVTYHIFLILIPVWIPSNLSP
jgi:hypothetical protein